MLRAFYYMFDDKNFLTKCFILLATPLIPILGILTFEGYMISCSRALIANESLPDFEFIDNLYIGFILAVCMMIVTGVVMIPIFLLSLNPNDLFFLKYAVILLFVFLPPLFLALYCNYIKNDTFISAIDVISACKTFISKPLEYLKALGFMILLSFGLSIVASILCLIPIIGFIITLFLGAYLDFVFAYINAYLIDDTKKQVKPHSQSFISGF